MSNLKTLSYNTKLNSWKCSGVAKAQLHYAYRGLTAPMNF